jgi:serine/threonine-protein kinase
MAQENLAGRTVAGYHLLERVGEGGTAMVYRAEHGDHGQCAVKILKPRLRTDENARKRFLRESEYGARVEHQSVVQTFDYGEEGGLYFLALEWAEGEPLSDFIQRSGRLVPKLVAHIVTQLAGALGAAHASGIIHRDLKPENIVYDPKTQIVKLLDFGIARDAQADPAQRLTRTGFFVGTLQYVAPEALSGELVGSEADIFSLATITYYLLTDLHPYDGRSPRELFQQLLTADARPLNQAAKGLKFSTELEKAVMAGLEREPSKRPTTVEKFAQGLALAAAGDGDGDGGKSGILGVFKSFIGR